LDQFDAIEINACSSPCSWFCCYLHVVELVARWTVFCSETNVYEWKKKCCHLFLNLMLLNVVITQKNCNGLCKIVN